MKVLVNITSYNRREMLTNLIEQLEGYDIIVWDDCSEFDLEGDFVFHKFKKNHGKKLAWEKYKYIFENMPKDYDYYFFLPDDVIVCDEFVDKAIKEWELVNDSKKACLSFSGVERTKTPNWTGYMSRQVGNVIKTQWNDLMFLCTKEFFNIFELENIDPMRFKTNPLISSGVGRQISLKLHRMGYSMYNVSEDLVTHIGNDDSKMNSEIRKQQPL